MKNRNRSDAQFFIVVLTTLCLASIGCTAAQKKAPAATKSTEPYRVEKEGQIPPVAPADVRKEADKEESYEEMPVTDDTVEAETVEPVNEVPSTPVVSDASAEPKPAAAAQKTMDGYRIQVFATGNEAAARSVREAVEVQVGVPAYVELIDGVYKVRVGDCPTREEADVLVKKCRDAGYGDAWVATSRIFIPKKQSGL
ncbi:MAG: Sporulation related domain [Candidatus Krumholzibacteriota bacterium]|nr:Sporulation related domain [Candidatus Krumholzibacteriota bacterium]